MWRVQAMLAAMALLSTPAHAANPLSDWAAVVISGDDEAAHANRRTETFDNARRDIGRALQQRGFSDTNMAEFSVEPGSHPDTKPGPARAADITASLARLTARAKGGCLFYLTSHGSSDGAVLADHILPPRVLASWLNSSCGGRPTVAVISACYSGVFVAALARPNRLVLTAARRDRSSFGCGESDKYPFFDACILQSLPASTDFLALARKTKLCVARREHDDGMRPPSDPQIWIGPGFHSPSFIG